MIIKNYFINEVKNILGPARQNYKILLLNILGFQVFRYFFAYLKYIFFNKNYFNNSDVILLKKNGYTIINNFFDKADFEKILKICKKIENETKFKIKHYGEKKVHSYDFFDEIYDQDLIFLRNYFIETLNKKNFMDDICEILNIKKQSIQNLSYEKIIVGDNFFDKGDSDSEFHADRFYPCIKMFLYLDDNKIDNGAFEYINKSHQFTLSRLKHEYLYSIFICAKSFFLRIMKFFGYVLKNDRVTFETTTIEKNFGINSIIACEAPANSLIICNNMGFHRRGKLNPNTSRSHLRLNLYDMQISKTKSFLLKFAKKFKNNI